MLISLSVIYTCFQEGSLSKYLIKQGESVAQCPKEGLALSSSFSIVSTLLLVLAAYIYGHVVNQPALFYLALAFGASFLIGWSNTVYRARIAYDLDFKGLARINAVSNSSNNLLMVPLAALGFGAFSFVAPASLAKAYEFFRFRRKYPSIQLWGFWRGLDYRQLAGHFKSLKWIMLSAVFIALIQKGDYFVLGILISPELLGVYFFGFQLSAALTHLITGSLNQVIMPSLVKLDGFDEKMRVYNQSIVMMALICMPLFLGLAIALGPVVNLLWSGKWNQSILVVQVLLLISPVRLLSPFSRSLFESLGRWRLVALMLAIDAIGTLAAAAIGGAYGSLEAIMICIGVWRFTIGVAQLLVASFIGKNQNAQALLLVLRIMLLFGVALLVSSLIDTSIWANANLGASLLSLLCFAGLSVAFGVAFLRKEYKSLWSGIRAHLI